ncbi:DUF6414 family protein [Mesorhizobium japonicum]|uniref:DUF6414 family protein n=1 Tax=Mesorhizobium japonicum TaxID=2066070 RepID=UPI003B5A6208
MAKQRNEASGPGASKVLLKVVYFDQDSASDYLDIASGGRLETSSENVKTRSTELRASVTTKLSAAFSFLPGLFSASARVQGSIDASAAGQSILRKTISNTILTDYLARVQGDLRIERLEGLAVTAPPDSMAYMKMFTPLTIVLRTEDSGLDVAKFDDAFVAAKGYYELVGAKDGSERCILRFNFDAFRNNYRLTDLTQMKLVFHAIRVGEGRADQLGLSAAMSEQPSFLPNAEEVLAEGPPTDRQTLPVYDVIFAGVEQGE